jgi:hypothetical protein
MFAATCPFCDREQRLPSTQKGERVKCPSCRMFFDALPDPDCPFPESPDPAGGTSRAPDQDPTRTTRLTVPHSCRQCRDAIHHPTGLRRCSISCPTCRRVTSIYAVIHHCSHCRVMLESPMERMGRDAACPACKRRITIPHDVVYRVGYQRPEAGTYYFNCPGCAARLHTTGIHVGKLAVCPSCLVPFSVPSSGDSQPDVHVAEPDVRAAIQRCIEWHCRSCGMLVPKRVRSCPCCGKS